MACVESAVMFDSECVALALQLEEIEAQRELQSGKWPEDNPPDFVLAFDNFEAEMRNMLFLIEDLRFAHSIAIAVDSDAVAIEELRVEELQSARDRELAISLNPDGSLPSQDIISIPEMPTIEEESVSWDHVLRATEASTFSDQSSTIIAGPSTHYTHRQNIVLEHMSQLKVECSVCGDAFHPHATMRLACTDIYCKPCLKSFFLRVTKDESLFPPTCHREAIDFSLIETSFTVEELTAYRNAELEFTSTNRVYCASSECAKFIPLSHRTTDRASCEACGAGTCMHCKGLAHDGSCPSEESRQSLIDFAADRGWQSCFGCGEMVARDDGCDHMT
ncbi:hypothetical protein ONS95_011884 [Cadophora gregata]|uniref:uncharacterized protein n=1 Tax=Cadophora gregata TaxID=51156 RepID=UPI0026DD15DB|nr:uncharacterized protein ONS95_011884 [Cadophora gregata]KAK0117546.1 hypothetical protein ONS95_011884 [Cadophora gregata]